MNSTVIKLKEIEVKTRNINVEYEGDGTEVDGTSSHCAYLLPNNAVLVVGQSTNDWFFDSMENYQCSGNDIVVDWECTGEIEEWTVSELRRSVIDSANEFGGDSVPSSVIELIRFAD